MYRCSGAEYDSFSTILSEYAVNRSGQSLSWWGRRPTALPDHASVLVLGNSHVRQNSHELVCQYAEQVTGLRVMYRNRGKLDGIAVTFRNNASLYLLANSPVEIALKWQDRLEMITQRRLESFQAVVVGQYNFDGKLPSDSPWRWTSHYAQLNRWAASDPGLRVVGDEFRPPDAVAVSERFAGPVLFVSSYMKPQYADAQKVMDSINEVRQLTGRTNLAGILSRKYVEMFRGHECAADQMFPYASDRMCSSSGSDGHRCVGPRGGYPTLIAHDVQESLFTLMDGMHNKYEM
jgi:hypothetical protein